MHPAKTAVAHHQHMVAGTGVGGDGADQRIQIGMHLRLGAEGGEGDRGIPVEAALIRLDPTQRKGGIKARRLIAATSDSYRAQLLRIL